MEGEAHVKSIRPFDRSRSVTSMIRIFGAGQVFSSSGTVFFELVEKGLSRDLGGG